MGLYLDGTMKIVRNVTIKFIINGDKTMDTVEDDIEIRIEKPSRAERWKRSIAARMRRQLSKFAKSAHLQKEEEEALDRIRAKKLLEKQKKQRRKLSVDN